MSADVKHIPFTPFRSDSRGRPTERFAWCGQRMQLSVESAKPCKLCKANINSRRRADFVEKWTGGRIRFTGSESHTHMVQLGPIGEPGVDLTPPPLPRQLYWPSFWKFCGSLFLVTLGVVGTIVGIAAGLSSLS